MEFVRCGIDWRYERFALGTFLGWFETYWGLIAIAVVETVLLVVLLRI